MKVINCEGCGHKEDVYNPLISFQINVGNREKSFLLCPICREKLVRIIEGGGL